MDSMEFIPAREPVRNCPKMLYDLGPLLWGSEESERAAHPAGQPEREGGEGHHLHRQQGQRGFQG